MSKGTNLAEINLTDFDDRQIGVCIAPCGSDKAMSYNEYLVRIDFDDRCIFDQEFSVDGWQLGHYYMYRLARAFRCSPRLFDTPPIVLTSDGGREYQHQINLREGPGWLIINVQAAASSLSRYAPRIVVDVFIEPGYRQNEPTDTVLSSCLRLWGWCHPDDAVKFGLKLEEECRVAEALRRRMKVPAPDDGLFTPMLCK